jgi:uncharacterized protein HemY
MKRFILFLCMLLVACFITLLLIENHSYIIFIYNSIMIKIPLWLALSASVVTVLLLYFCVTFVKIFIFLPKKFNSHFLKKKRLKGFKYISNSVGALLSNNWSLLEQYNTSLKIYLPLNMKEEAILFKCKALFEQAKYDELKSEFKAYESKNKVSESLVFIYVESLISKGEYDSAILLLLKSLGVYKKSLVLYEQLAKVYIKKQNYKALANILNITKQLNLISIDLEKSYIIYYKNNLKTLREKSNTEFQIFWKSIPKTYKNKAEIISIYIEGLYQHHDFNKADNVVKKEMKDKWNIEIYLIYLKYSNSKILDIYNSVSVWIDKFSPELVGDAYFQYIRVMIDANDLSKAEKLLQQFLELNSCAQGYALLSDVYDRLNKQAFKMKFELDAINHLKGIK